MSSKKVIKCVLIVSGFVFFGIGLFLGVMWGATIAENEHTKDFNDLNKTLNAISEYYDKMNEYPTDDNFYLQPQAWSLPLESVTDKQVTLYSGIAGSHVYTIEFTGDGEVSVTRK